MIHKSLVVLGVMFIVMSCQQEMSLQSYLVEKENDSSFISASLSSNLIFQNLDTLSTELNTSLRKIKKVNLLALSKNKGGDNLANENDQLNAVLSNSEYDILMQFNSSDRIAKLLYGGEDSNINDLILYGFDDQKGLLLLIMHGEDMNATDLYNISQSAQQLNFDALPSGFETILGE